MPGDQSAATGAGGLMTKVPFLLKHSLRPYQHVGLDWLANLNDRHLNGILVSLF
jgi:SNF2 family DNA or RNA helicase